MWCTVLLALLAVVFASKFVPLWAAALFVLGDMKDKSSDICLLSEVGFET